MYEPIFNAKELACYIKGKYQAREKTKKTKEIEQISPIKLQKALYLCFAYWAGFVNKGKIDKVIPDSESDILFDDEIQAWAYGPVVPTVYFLNKDRELLYNTEEEEDTVYNTICKKILDNAFLKETIDSLLDDIFQISDFKLVSICHMDKSWQRHFHSEQDTHNEEIPKSEIIDEYTRKSFI